MRWVGKSAIDNSYSGGLRRGSRGNTVEYLYSFEEYEVGCFT